MGNQRERAHNKRGVWTKQARCANLGDMVRVLVVDDDVLILQALTRILSAEGYQVVAHTNPVRAAEERDFAVVITDFMMPNMNGIELLGHFKRHNPDAVRLMLTAAADFRVASEAVNRGEVFRILAKPWTLSDLTACVKQSVLHHQLLAENRRLSEELASKNAQLVAMNHDLERRVVERTSGLLEGMVAALDYRDTETQWHSRRVSLYSKRLAQAAGVGGLELEVVEQGALLHDIGKIGVRDSILLKPTKLTEAEWVEMRLHPEIGFRILSRLPWLAGAALIVFQHQERFDGSGYPLGLKGQQIVTGARVFALADTMDAITSDRPYRQGRPLEVAKEEILRFSGSQFDPELVDAFLAIPDQDWQSIRAEVEQMAQKDFQQWDPRVLPESLRRLA